MHTANWNELEEVMVRTGVYRKGFTGEGATMAIHRFLPEHKPQPHKHHYEQLVFIMKGKIKFHVGDEFVILEEGGLLVVPPNVEHWGELIGNEEVINLDVFTPVRKEYA